VRTAEHTEHEHNGHTLHTEPVVRIIMMKYSRSPLTLLVVTLVSFLLLMKPGHSTMVGGYSLIQDPEENPRLPAVTENVLEQLGNSPYSFASVVSGEHSLEIVEAYQQVVAGMNYRLLLLLKDGSQTAVGAFTVTVYDQFGTFADTTWGDEVSVEEALKKLQGGGQQDDPN
jgi:hypothetical protein